MWNMPCLKTGKKNHCFKSHKRQIFSSSYTNKIMISNVWINYSGMCALLNLFQCGWLCGHHKSSTNLGLLFVNHKTQVSLIFHRVTVIILIKKKLCSQLSCHISIINNILINAWDCNICFCFSSCVQVVAEDSYLNEVQNSGRWEVILRTAPSCLSSHTISSFCLFSPSSLTHILTQMLTNPSVSTFFCPPAAAFLPHSFPLQLIFLFSFTTSLRRWHGGGASNSSFLGPFPLKYLLWTHW